MVEARGRRGAGPAGSVSLARLHERARRRGLELTEPVWAAMTAALADGQLVGPADLGAVYEAYLARNRVTRRSAGAYYTPSELVRFVVARALDPLLHDATAVEVKALRVVDPCVGGGAFALEVHRRITARLVALGEDPSAAARAALGCVRGFDRDPVAVAVTSLALDLAAGLGAGDHADEAIAIEIGRADFLDPALVCNDRIDAVVGNPPWGAKGYVFPGDNSALRRDYRTARGALDPCKLFVERAAALVRDGGRIAFVLPDVVLLKGHPSFRRYILDTLRIDGIAHLGRCFSGALIDAIAMFLVREQAPPDHRVAIWDDPLGGANAAPPPAVASSPPGAVPDATTPQALFARMPAARFNLYWSDAALAVYEQLAAGDRLGDAFEVHEGVHTGNVRDKLFAATADTPGARPVIVGGRELSRYRLDWAGRYLDTRPNTIDAGAGEYANLGREAWFLRPKLVVRRTGDRLVAAVDEEGLYVSNNLFVLLPKQAAPADRDDTLDALWAACAILNSALLTWVFRAIEPRVGRLFAELKINHLVRLPWRGPNREQTQRLAALARHLAVLTAANHPGGAALPTAAAGPLAAAGPDAAAGGAAIDREVAALYGIADALPAMRRAGSGGSRQTR